MRPQQGKPVLDRIAGSREAMRDTAGLVGVARDVVEHLSGAQVVLDLCLEKLPEMEKQAP
jgi:hypothetical protein